MTLRVRLQHLVVPAAFVATLAWAFWPTLNAMADKWSTDAQYSHGFLVPVFAAVLLYHRRDLLGAWSTPKWWGLVIIGCGLALHLGGAYSYFDTLSMLALLPVLAGMCLCCGGWPALRWALPSICFMLFMVPMPFRMQVAFSNPLQRVATYCSTYVLQTLGLPAMSEGNIILLNDIRIGVVEACNGLGMLVTFFALTTATALVLQRSFITKLLIVVSAIPIALIANVLRITVTSILHAYVGGDVADMVFHDVAGWLMMPLALGLLWLEFRMVALLVVDDEPEVTAAYGLGVTPKAPKPETEQTAEAQLV
jgi:exosortase